MRHLAPAAFWRAWAIWAISVAATAAALGYTAVHPLPAKLASQAGSGLDGVVGVVGVVFIAAFATVGALLAWTAAVRCHCGVPPRGGPAAPSRLCRSGRRPRPCGRSSP